MGLGHARLCCSVVQGRSSQCGPWHTLCGCRRTPGCLRVKRHTVQCRAFERPRLWECLMGCCARVRRVQDPHTRLHRWQTQDITQFT